MATPKLDYRWHLRELMVYREMFQTSDLIAPLAQRGVEMSSSQAYRLVVSRPERLSLKVLMALLDILDCRMDELIEPVPEARRSTRPRRASAGGSPQAGVGDLRPRRARITPPPT